MDHSFGQASKNFLKPCTHSTGLPLSISGWLMLPTTYANFSRRIYLRGCAMSMKN